MSKNVEVEVDIVDQVTDKAIHCILSESGRKVWIPRHVIVDAESEIQSDAGENDSGTLVIWKSFATKEGIGED